MVREGSGHPIRLTDVAMSVDVHYYLRWGLARKQEGTNKFKRWLRSGMSVDVHYYLRWVLACEEECTDSFVVEYGARSLACSACNAMALAGCGHCVACAAALLVPAEQGRAGWPSSRVVVRLPSAPGSWLGGRGRAWTLVPLPFLPG